MSIIHILIKNNYHRIKDILDLSHISQKEFLRNSSRTPSLLGNKRKLDADSKEFVDIQLINALIGQIGKNAYLYLHGEYKNSRSQESVISKNSNKKG